MHLETQFMDLLSEHLRYHRPPPVVLASGRSTLVDKFCATMHALWLETGSARSLHTFCRSVASLTTDLGVEFGLSDVHPATLGVVLPFVDVPNDDPPAVLPHIMMSEDCLLDDVPIEPEPEPEAPGGLLVGFDSAMALPGLLDQH